jgi:hypothetical protein
VAKIISFIKIRLKYKEAIRYKRSQSTGNSNPDNLYKILRKEKLKTIKDNLLYKKEKENDKEIGIGMKEIFTEKKFKETKIEEIK